MLGSDGLQSGFWPLLQKKKKTLASGYLERLGRRIMRVSSPVRGDNRAVVQPCWAISFIAVPMVAAVVKMVFRLLRWQPMEGVLVTRMGSVLLQASEVLYF